MTRDDAEVFMFGLKNYQWQQHPLLYEHVELGIKMIYDDLESMACENCSYYTDNGNCAGLQIKTDSDFYCKSWESK